MDNLARNAMLAKQAGMSYGKWKAMQPPAAIIPKPPKEGFTRQICEYCGCEFIRSDNRKRKYCGDKCRNATNDKNNYERNKKK